MLMQAQFGSADCTRIYMSTICARQSSITENDSNHVPLAPPGHHPSTLRLTLQTQGGSLLGAHSGKAQAKCGDDLHFSHQSVPELFPRCPDVLVCGRIYWLAKYLENLPSFYFLSTRRNTAFRRNFCQKVLRC